MNVEDVIGRVANIGRMADDEAAHAEEDELYRDVLRAIAEGTAVDGAQMAAEALRTAEFSFARWYA